MAESFKFELVSPQKLLLSEQVTAVNAPGTEGYFTIMSRHAPMMTTLSPGIVGVTLESGEERRFFVMGGFVDVGSDGVTLLAEDATMESEFSIESLDARIERAELRLAEADDDESNYTSAENLARLRTARSQMSA